MEQEKKRPSLDELKAMPKGLLLMEVAQLCFDAGIRERYDVLSQAEEMMLSPEVEPEQIVELWNRLRRGTDPPEVAIPFSNLT